jgi:MFS family permease
VPPIIYGDIGGTDRWIWFVLANLLSLAAVCPFVGSISDLIGRRYVALMGASFVVLGMIICSTAHSMNIFICGMVFAGVGAGINELTALAATSELAPTSQRGKYVAILVFTIIPFCPSVLWGQLIAAHAGWRWIGLLCGLWAGIGLIMTAVFYFPPPRVNSSGLTRKEVLQQIDYVGGFLSIAGMLASFRARSPLYEIYANISIVSPTPLILCETVRVMSQLLSCLSRDRMLAYCPVCLCFSYLCPCY